MPRSARSSLHAPRTPRSPVNATAPTSKPAYIEARPRVLRLHQTPQLDATPRRAELFRRLDAAWDARRGEPPYPRLPPRLGRLPWRTTSPSGWPAAAPGSDTSVRSAPFSSLLLIIVVLFAVTHTHRISLHFWGVGGLASYCIEC